MAATLPYLVSYAKLDTLFAKIAAAKQPDAFTHGFLSETLGLSSSTDRPLIPFLRTLGFLDPTGKPTAAYAELKNPERARIAIARAVRSAYAPLFAANERAHELAPEALKGLIAQVAGSDDGMTAKILGTLRALLKLADFQTQPERPGKEKDNQTPVEPVEQVGNGQTPVVPPVGALRPEFHYNIQIHLPSNATEDVYLSIFNALRRTFS